MKFLHRLHKGLRWAFGRSRVERELDAELRSFLDHAAAEKMRDGLPAEEAARQARMELRGVEQTKERIRAGRPGAFAAAAGRDLRLAGRRLARNPALTLAAILSLALGVGFGTAIFSFVNLLLIRPLPVTAPDRLVSINRNATRGPLARQNLSYPDFTDLRDQSTVFDGVAAMRLAPMYPGGEGAGRVLGYIVSGNYFEVLGVQPHRGRLISPEDDIETDGHPVAVIGHAFWQRHFGGDENVVGRELRLNGRTFEVIGVAPPGFGGTEVIVQAEIWAPFSMLPALEVVDWRPRRGTSNAWVIARLGPSVTVQAAEAELSVLAGRLAAAYPEIHEGLHLGLSRPGLLGAGLRPAVMGAGAALLLLAALTLLIVCANLSGIFLAAGIDRQDEFAVRAALGARRRDLVRAVLAEGLLLAGAGAGLALLLAAWMRDVLVRILPTAEFMLNADVPLDWRVAAFAIASSVAALALFSLLPAIRSTRGIALHLRTARSIGRRRRFELRDGYVAAQIAFAVVLVGVAAMTAATLDRVMAANVGLEPTDAYTLRAELRLAGYDEVLGRGWQETLLARVRRLPGIENAALASSVPFSLSASRSSVQVEGEPTLPAAERIPVFVYLATPGFFPTLGIPLTAGRDFDERDGADSPAVAVVNQAFVDQILPAGRSPLGIRFRFGGEPIEIVGVAAGGRHSSLTGPPEPAVWQPMAQRYNGEPMLVVRSSLDAAATLTAMREAVREMDPSVPVFDANPVSAYLDFPLAPLRLIRAVTTGMAALGMVLSAVGLYGLLTYMAARRRREFGLRLAVGARPIDLAAAALLRPVLIFGTGAVIGLGLYSLASAGLSELLYIRAGRWAPTTAVLVLALACLLAGLGPVRRILRLDLAAVLRME